jgi:hypothetical protein
MAGERRIEFEGRVTTGIAACRSMMTLWIRSEQGLSLGSGK